MRKISSKILTVLSFTLLAIPVLGLFMLGSCEVLDIAKENETQKSYSIKLSVEAVGHQFIYVRTENKVDNYYDESRILYDTVQMLFDSVSSVVKYDIDYENTTIILDAEPNHTYYLQSRYFDLISNVETVEMLPTDFTCPTPVRNVVGDMDANQYGFNGLTIRNNRLTSVLMGDFKGFDFYIPEPTGGYDFVEGVYTTINDYEGEKMYRNPLTAIVTFKTFSNTVYYAKADQAISVKSPGDFTSELVAEFCDMVFVNTDTGQEITLSGKLN